MKPLRRIADAVVREMSQPAWTDLPGEVAANLAGSRSFTSLRAGGLIDDRGLDTVAFEKTLLAQLKSIGFEGEKSRGLAKKATEHAANIVTFLMMPGAWPNDPASSTRLSWRKNLGAIVPVERPPIRPIDIEASPAKAKDVMVSGTRLRTIDVPARKQEKAVVLLIHGHSSCIEEHTGFLHDLTEHCRVIACDLPGCGYSDHPARDYTLAYYEETLLGLMDALGIQQCAVAGGSLGGNLSLRMALRYPERVTRVVSWAPANWLGVDEALGFARALDESTFWFVLGRQAETWYSADYPNREEAIRGSIAYRREVFNPNYLEAYKDIATEQVRTTMKPKAKDIRVPVKLMVGKNDTALDMIDGVRELAKLIPDAKLVELDGKHSIADEQAKRVVQEIETFVCV